MRAAPTRLSLATALVVAVGVAEPAAAADWYVTTGGSDAAGCAQATPCRTIAATVAKVGVADGDTIHIGPGEFDEGVKTSKRLVFEGSGSGTPQGADTSRDTFVDANGVSAIGFELDHGGTLRHLRVRGGGQGDNSNAPDDAIYLHAFSAATPVSYTLDGVVAIGGSAGTTGKMALRVSDNGGTGAAVSVSVTGDTYLTTPIAGGLLSGWAVFVYGTNVSAGMDGTAIGPPKDGLGLSVGGGAAATLKNTRVLGIFAPGTAATVSGAGSELKVDHSSLGAADVAVSAGSGTSLTVDDSLLLAQPPSAPAAGVTPDALRVGGSGSGSTAAAVVRNSTLVATGPGVRSAAAVTAASSGTATLSLGNTALRATDTDGSPGDTDLYVNGAGGTTASVSADASAFTDRTLVGTGTSTDPGSGTNVSGDPLFSAPDNGNYVPGPGSPLIDRGNPQLVGAGALDLAGNPRGVDGDANCSALPDIGAYEAPEMTAPGCTPVPDTTAPRVALGPAAQRLPKTGALLFSVRCPAAEPDPCAGTLRVQAGALALGTAAIGPLAPGATQAVSVAVPGPAQRTLRKKRSQRLTLTATLTDPAGNTGTTTKQVLLTTRPRVGLRAAKTLRRGALPVSVTCPAAEPGACAGTVSVLLGKRVVGRAKLTSLAHGTRRTLAPKLAPRVTAAGHRLRLTLVATITDALGNTGRTTASVSITSRSP